MNLQRKVISINNRKELMTFPTRVAILAAGLIVSSLVVAVYRLTAHMEPAGFDEFLELVLPHLRQSFHPEINERNAYFAYIIFAPLVPALLALLYYRTKLKRKTERVIETVDTWLSQYNWFFIVLAAGLFLFVPLQTLTRNYLFHTTVFSGINLILGLVLFAFICCAAQRGKAYRFLYWISCAMCLAAVIFSLWLIPWNVFSIYETHGHYTAYASSVYAVVLGGRTLFVDYTPQYGLYGYLLAPFFRFLPLNLRTFSSLMAALMLVAYACNYLTLRVMIEDRLIRMLAFFNIVYFTVIFHNTALPTGMRDSYFQFFPHRFLFPSIILFLFVKFMMLPPRDQLGTLNQKRSLGWFSAMLVASSVGIMWNFDTGFVAYGATVVSLGFAALCNTVAFKGQHTKFSTHWRYFLVFLVGVPLLFFVALQAVTFVRSGTFLDDFFGVVFFQRVFYNYGFFMIRMPYIHSWIILALVYFVGICLAAFHLVGLYTKKESSVSVHHVILLFISVLGVGLFSYYQGRSHDQVFIKVVTWAFFSLALLVCKSDLFLPQKDENHRTFGFMPTRIISRFFLCFVLFLAPFSVLTDFDRFVQTAEARTEIRSAYLPAPWAHPLNSLLINEDEVIILSHNVPWFGSRLGRFCSIAEASLIETFLIEQSERHSYRLNRNLTKLVIFHGGHVVPSHNIPIWRYGGVTLYKPEGRDMPFLGVVASELEVPAGEDVIAVFIRHGYEVYVSSTPQHMVDFEGRFVHMSRSRFPVQLDFPDEFTIQALVFPQTQEGSHISIIDSHAYWAGFAVQQVGDKDNIFRFFYGNGTDWVISDDFELVPYEWNELRIVFGRTSKKVYVNSRLVSDTMLDGEMVQSVHGLIIGNFIHAERRFNGKIQEVLITGADSTRQDGR